jgi:hypothetical protein
MRRDKKLSQMTLRLPSLQSLVSHRELLAEAEEENSKDLDIFGM